MKTREQIIDSMCLTWRHDFRLDKDRFSGMTEEERECLRGRMAQLFDNDILPHMEFRKEPRKTRLVRDGVIEVHSFELTEREQRRISLALKYGPASAAMKDDGTFWESQATPRDSWRSWIFRKFLGKP